MEHKTSAADCDELEMPEAMEYDRIDLTSGPNESILKLTDDCFLEAFSHLSDFDLCAISDTCQRLTALAKKEFRCRYGKKDFDIIIVSSPLDDATSKILKHFGQLIVSLRVDYYESEESDWLFISKHCNGFTRMSITCKPLENLSEAFQKRLSKNVFKQKHKTPIDFFVELQRINYKFLHLIKNHFDFRQFSESCPVMENYRCLSALMKACREDIVKMFLRTHPQLKKFRSMGWLEFDADTIRYMRDIEHLCLVQSTYYDKNVLFDIELNALSKLKCLELYFKYDGAIIARKLNSLNPQMVHHLESLGIPASLMHENFAEMICKFINLKSLKIVNNYLAKENVIEVIAGKLEQLEYLDIGFPLHFGTVQGVIEKSSKLKSLMVLPPASIDETHFLQLVDARKRSNAAYPLVIYLNKPNQMSESYKLLTDLRQRHMNVIQLKDGACPVLTMNFFRDPYTEIFPRVGSTQDL